MDIVLGNIVMSGAKLFFLSPKWSGKSTTVIKHKIVKKKAMFFYKDSFPLLLIKLSKCSIVHPWHGPRRENM